MRWARRPAGAGFTLVEGAVATALLAVVAAGLVIAGVSATRVLRQASALSADAAALALADRAVRAAVGAVRIPYWEHQEVVQITASGARLPFYRDDPHRVVVVTVTDDGWLELLVEGAGTQSDPAEPAPQQQRFGPFAGGTVQALLDEAQRTVGVSVTVQGHHAPQPATIAARFGATAW